MSHYMRTHPTEIQKCPKCDMLITNSRSVPHHWKAKHSQVIMPYYLSLGNDYCKDIFKQFVNKFCKLCKRKMDTIAESREHFHQKHKIFFEICLICSVGLQTKRVLRAHNFRKHKYTKIDRNCVKVGCTDKTTSTDDATMTDSEDEKRLEIVKFKKVEVIEIKSETRKFDRKNDQDTSSARSRSYPFIISNKCPICSKNLTRRPHVIIHYKRMHAKNGNSCDLCGIKFANKSHEKQHWLAIHSDTPWKVKAITIIFFELFNLARYLLNMINLFNS